MACDMNNDICCCKNVLDLDKLCAECARVCWLKAKKIWVDKAVSNDVCSQTVEVKMLSAENETANMICAQGVTAGQVSANSLNANSLCSVQGTINDLCVDNLRVKNMMLCNKYRATAVLSADTLYTLGSNINFDVVLDDPNGNVSVGPFKYTAPKSGYYTITVHIDMAGISGASVITGVPVAHLVVNVNGMPFRDILTPFLTFSDAQTSILTSLILLNAGDIVQSDYEIKILNPTSGEINFTGTVTIKGNGTFPNKCSFGIILNSELCADQPQCVTCPPVQIPCVPFTVPCHPVVPPSDCDDCDQPTGMANERNNCEPCIVPTPEPTTASATASSGSLMDKIRRK